MNNHILCQMNSDFSCECKKESKEEAEKRSEPLFQINNNQTLSWDSGTTATIDSSQFRMSSVSSGSAPLIISSQELVNEFIPDEFIEEAEDEIQLDEEEVPRNEMRG